MKPRARSPQPARPEEPLPLTTPTLTPTPWYSSFLDWFVGAPAEETEKRETEIIAPIRRNEPAFDALIKIKRDTVESERRPVPTPVSVSAFLPENMQFFVEYGNRNNTQIGGIGMTQFLRNVKNGDFVHYKEDVQITRVKRLTTTGINSIIYDLQISQLPYTPTSDKFDTILKVVSSSRLPEGYKALDNLYYEYFVGKCVNEFKKCLPNFTYTLAYLNFKPDFYRKMELGQVVVSDDFVNGTLYFDAEASESILLKEKIMKTGCGNNKIAGIIMEKLPNIISVEDFLLRKDVGTYEVLSVLYQLYAALHATRDLFTHYDLHTSNVYIVKLEHEIEMDYHDNEIGPEPVKIFTRFIPVIIDYGRSFVDCNKMRKYVRFPDIKSTEFIDKACHLTPDCNSLYYPECNLLNTGTYVKTLGGGKWSNNETFHYINVRKNNKSSDVRFIREIIASYDIRISPMKRMPFFEQLKYVFNSSTNPEWYFGGRLGVLEQERQPRKIKQVSDAYEYFRQKLVEETTRNINVKKMEDQVDMLMVIDLSLQQYRAIYIKKI